MKILYYLPEYDTPMFSWQRVHIFDELKRSGVDIDVVNPLMYESYDEANEYLINVARGNHYDMFLTCLCSERMIYEATLSEIKKLGIPTVSFRPDNLLIPFYDKNLAKYFDLVWLTSVETQHLYDKWGAKSIFLPYAANPYTFTPSSDAFIRRVCFIGRPYGSRPVMINQLTQNGVDVDVFCKGNEHIFSVSSKNPIKQHLLLPSKVQVFFDSLKFAEGRKMIASKVLYSLKKATQLDENSNLHLKNSVLCSELGGYYSQYVIALAATSAANSDILKKPISVVQLRNFEIPMSGGVEFCKYNEELASYFEEDKEIVFYRNDEELIDKSMYYTKKASDAEIQNLKNNARKRSMNEHTWMCRFNKIFDTVGIKI